MFLTYNPVAGCLVHTGNDPMASATNDALNSARKMTTDERWKAGHSFDEPQGPRSWHAKHWKLSMASSKCSPAA